MTQGIAMSVQTRLVQYAKVIDVDPRWTVDGIGLAASSLSPLKTRTTQARDSCDLDPPEPLYPPTIANTLSGLPLPFTILSGAAITTAPVGGS